MKAVKGNKVYTIDEKQKNSYRENGYDIIGDSGEVIEYGKGKTVPYNDFMMVKKELEEAKAARGQADNQDVLDFLTAYAQEHSIDLGRATSISSIVKKIKESGGE